MQVIIKKPGKAGEVCEIGNNLETLQEIVNGYIETVSFLEDVVLICNEKGLINNLPFNMCFLGEQIFGTFVLVGQNDEDLTDLPEEFIPTLLNYIEKMERRACGC